VDRDDYVSDTLGTLAAMPGKVEQELEPDLFGREQWEELGGARTARLASSRLQTEGDHDYTLDGQRRPTELQGGVG
jgi:hypothetical protein